MPKTVVLYAAAMDKCSYRLFDLYDPGCMNMEKTAKHSGSYTSVIKESYTMFYVTARTSDSFIIVIFHFKTTSHNI